MEFCKGPTQLGSSLTCTYMIKMEVTDIDKHANLLQSRIDYVRKKSYSKGPRSQCYFFSSSLTKEARLLVPCEPFQSCLIFHRGHEPTLVEPLFSLQKGMYYTTFYDRN